MLNKEKVRIALWPFGTNVDALYIVIVNGVRPRGNTNT
jgi:hypothetical protein